MPSVDDLAPIADESAFIFTGSIIVHMARIFFTGAFRKPRELNWTIGLLMLILIFGGRLAAGSSRTRMSLIFGPLVRIVMVLLAVSVLGKVCTT